MAEILLINRGDITKLAGVKGNLDYDKILPHVKTSQDIHLQTIIGTSLLNKLKQLVEDDELGDDGNEKYNTLVVTYITPMLVYYTLVDAIPFLVYEISNSGVNRHTPENAQAPDPDELAALTQNFKDKAEFYARRLEDYITANSSSFSEYYTSTTGEMPSSDAAPFHGWVM